jgi:DNA-binding CsgD family transcriptional regulator
MLQPVRKLRSMEGQPVNVAFVGRPPNDTCQLVSLTDRGGSSSGLSLIDKSAGCGHNARRSGRLGIAARSRRGVSGVSYLTVLDAGALMDLVGALRQLGATISLPPSLTEALHAVGVDRGRHTRVDSGAQLGGEVLTDTEVRVLHYLPTHLTVQEIARELSRSVDTVKTHVRHLYMKLDAHSRSEAVRRARSLGLLV